MYVCMYECTIICLKTTRIHTRTCLHTHTYVCMCIYAYTYIHTYICMQVLASVSWDDLGSKFYDYLFEEDASLEQMFVTERYVRMYVCICICMYVCIDYVFEEDASLEQMFITERYVCMCVYVYVYVCMY